jgi:hypothetical protein
MVAYEPAVIVGTDERTTADDAVSYLLQRYQTDPDLRWILSHTEAFRRLCRAEAERTGESPECVADRRSVDLQPRHRRRSARLPTALRHLEAISNAARLVLDRFGPVGLSDRGEGLRELQAALESAEEGGLL